MKRIVLVTAFIVLLVLPVFSQFRLDLGVDIPMTVGVLGQGEISTSNEIGSFLRDHWLPFPEAGLYYQFNVGPLKIAPGVRVFTFILESILWPNIIAELQLGPLFIEAQLGGLAFVVFGLVNSADFGNVIIPDLSAWLGLGKKRNFRIGAGVLGLGVPDLTTEGLLIVPYIGAKVSLLFG